MSTKKREDYVSNADLFKALNDYSDRVVAAVQKGEDTPTIPTYIAECIIKIATRLAYRPNFKNYTFRDEMIADGIENAINAVKSFDSKKSQNPFAYFTQIIWWAFVRRIQSEKKYLYTKYVVSRRAELLDMTSGSQEGDDSRYQGSLAYGEWSQEQMDRFMDDFEKKLSEKKGDKKVKIDKKKRVI